MPNSDLAVSAIKCNEYYNIDIVTFLVKCYNYFGHLSSGSQRNLLKKMLINDGFILIVSFTCRCNTQGGKWTVL